MRLLGRPSRAFVLFLLPSRRKVTPKQSEKKRNFGQEKEELKKRGGLAELGQKSLDFWGRVMYSAESEQKKLGPFIGRRWEAEADEPVPRRERWASAGELGWVRCGTSRAQ